MSYIVTAGNESVVCATEGGAAMVAFDFYDRGYRDVEIKEAS